MFLLQSFGQLFVFTSLQSHSVCEISIAHIIIAAQSSVMNSHLWPDHSGDANGSCMSISMQRIFKTLNSPEQARAVEVEKRNEFSFSVTDSAPTD